jgi:hypothetical protein
MKKTESLSVSDASMFVPGMTISIPDMFWKWTWARWINGNAPMRFRARIWRLFSFLRFPITTELRLYKVTGVQTSTNDLTVRKI